MFGGIVILAPIGLVDGINRLLFGRDLFAPVGDFVGQACGSRSGLGALASRRSFIRLHAAARRVDDEHTLFARLFQHLIHARCHLALAGDGVFAVMQIPHVADDDGRPGWQPGFFDLRGPAGWRAGLQAEREWCVRGER